MTWKLKAPSLRDTINSEVIKRVHFVVLTSKSSEVLCAMEVTACLQQWVMLPSSPSSKTVASKEEVHAWDALSLSLCFSGFTIIQLLGIAML